MLRVSLVGLIAGGGSGIPRYAAALTTALDGVAHDYPQLSLQLLTTPAGAERTALRSIELELVSGRWARASEGPRRILAEQLAARASRAGLLHFFDLSLPLLAPRRPFVATLHDAAIRHEFQGLRVAHKQVLQPLSIRHARAIVSVSAFARDEAVDHFGADAGRIHVVHSGPGFAPARFPSNGRVGADACERAGAEAPARVRGDSPVPEGPYLLYVGNFIAHKNLPFLIRAFAAADVAARLLIIGSWGGGLEPVRDAIAASPAADRIELRSGTSDADLDQLYRGARALLLPSLYEGFGFTTLEAMARECAVLASDIPALREVCGDGAWLLPPSDTAAWAQAIRTVLGGPTRIEELRRAGAKAVAGYSWERTARGVCDVLLRVGQAAG